MNKKQLYESIMASVAKEVKKALLENDNEYSSYDEARLNAIHFNQLPNDLKEISNGEEWILSGKMSDKQLIEFVANVDWDLLYNQYKHFYPKAYSFSEDYINDMDISMDGGTVYANVPCSDISLEVNFVLKWRYIPYRHGDYYQPSEGGYGELKDCKIIGIEIIDNDRHIKLTKEEINFYKLQNLFVDEITMDAEDMDQDNYFHQKDDDAYDRWKDEQ